MMAHRSFLLPLLCLLLSTLEWCAAFCPISGLLPLRTSRRAETSAVTPLAMSQTLPNCRSGTRRLPSLSDVSAARHFGGITSCWGGRTVFMWSRLTDARHFGRITSCWGGRTLCMWSRLTDAHPPSVAALQVLDHATKELVDLVIASYNNAPPVERQQSTPPWDPERIKAFEQAIRLRAAIAMEKLEKKRNRAAIAMKKLEKKKQREKQREKHCEKLTPGAHKLCKSVAKSLSIGHDRDP